MEWVGIAVVLGTFAFLLGYLFMSVTRRLRAQEGPEGAARPWTLLSLVIAIGLYQVVHDLVGADVALALLWLLTLGLITSPVWRRRLRPEAPPAAPKAGPADLPPEYRYAEGPRWVPAVAVLAFIAIGFLGTTVSDSPTVAAITLAGMCASGIGATAVLLTWRRRHQLEIIESVEREAKRIDPSELHALVRRLELEHGRLEMRRLRRLLKRPSSAQA
jgi:hypothetical protein